MTKRKQQLEHQQEIDGKRKKICFATIILFIPKAIIRI